MAITIGTSTITVNSGAVMADPPGTAGLFFARAWVHFNGTGTLSIRASGGVSSITDNSAGNYTMNFSTAMTDTNYSVVGSANGSGVSIIPIVSVNQDNDQTTSATDLYTTGGATGTPVDFYNVNVAIFR